MKAIVNPKKSLLHKVEYALNEFYSRSIYKQMIDDITGQFKNEKKQNEVYFDGACDNKPYINEKNFKYKARFNNTKKADQPQSDTGDIPGMLYI